MISRPATSAGSTSRADDRRALARRRPRPRGARGLSPAPPDDRSADAEGGSVAPAPPRRSSRSARPSTPCAQRDVTARAALDRAARRAAEELGREDARPIARYYLALPAQADAPSLEAESRDSTPSATALRATTRTGPHPPPTLGALLRGPPFPRPRHRGSRGPRSPRPAALAQSRPRGARAGGDPTGAMPDASTSLTVSISRRAQDALARFDAAGMSTPRLEPLWTLARVALLGGSRPPSARSSNSSDEPPRAGRQASRRSARSSASSASTARGARPSPRVRALAALAPCVDGWTPAESRREVAVQRLLKDDPRRRAPLAAGRPPSIDDDEIDLEGAEAGGTRCSWPRTCARAAPDPRGRPPRGCPPEGAALLDSDRRPRSAALDALAGVDRSARAARSTTRRSGRTPLVARASARRRRANRSTVQRMRSSGRRATPPPRIYSTVKDAERRGEVAPRSRRPVDLAV